MEKIELEWEEFKNFFELWDKYKDATQLIYVIGDSEYVYIGCIGIRDGKGGLKVRYQKQYMDRAKAIFGKKACDGQVSYAATFIEPQIVTGKIIEAAESIIQSSFVVKCGADNALFKPVKVKEGFSVTHTGKSKPKFL